MNPWPLPLAPEQRALLREFECVYQEWRDACAAADALEDRVAAEQREEIDRLLEYRLAADRMHQKAMQLLRARPI
jgi:hypothetical protein